MSLYCQWLAVMLSVSVQVHIEFTEEQDQIRLEGPPEDVEQAVTMLQDLVDDLVCDATSSGSTAIICLVFVSI